MLTHLLCVFLSLRLKRLYAYLHRDMLISTVGFGSRSKIVKACRVGEPILSRPVRWRRSAALHAETFFVGDPATYLGEGNSLGSSQLHVKSCIRQELVSTFVSTEYEFPVQGTTAGKTRT